ncbi:Uncharacterised protein [Klebsiella pneumoniae]|uniref:hypothetical protein n=1 Tax=Klebsiella pneumoniae TaxID=573 RepID=UPI000E2BB550|nr:hypothetical protein [Klebsiella pneumoniae]VVK73864.1 Uncharacterised protein [Klebsiella pneumoniae]
MKNEIEQIAQQNDMSIEFVTWFFNEKKANCGNVWFMMMAAMWEGWKGRSIEMDKLAAENVALSKDAQRYRFIRERDMFGSDNESGLLSWEELSELECNEFDDALDARINHPNTGFIELDAKMQARKTPATDAYRAGIKADGVEDEPFGFVSRSGDLVVIELNGDQHIRDGMPVFVKDLREGAK